MRKLFTTTLSLFVLLTNSYLFAQNADPENNSKLFKTNVTSQPKGSDTLFVNGTGDDFDKLLRREEVPNGRSTYKVTIDRYYSQAMSFDANGFLLNAKDMIAKKLIPETALLILRVFDVDHNGKTGFKPEVDHVYVNGKQVKFESGAPFTLTSGNQKWSINPINIPIEFLKFPRFQGTNTTKPSVENLIEIDIDQYAQRWQVKCDWISIEIKSPIRPVLMIHGFIASPASWDTFRQFFNIDGIPFHVPAADIINPIGAINDNAIAIHGEIPKVLNKFGVDKVNIVAHSKGGLDSRMYLRIYGNRKKVESLIQLATPNHGSEAAEKGLFATKLTTLANASKRRMPASEQLSTSWLRDNFNYSPVNDIIHSFKPIFTEKKYKSSIFVLTGIKFDFTAGVFLKPFDSIVSALSTTLPWNDLPPNFPPSIPITANNMYPNVPFTRINNGEFPLDHTEMHEEKTVYDKVISILKPFGLSNLNNSQGDYNIDVLNKFVVINDTSISRIIYNETDSLGINEQRIINVNIDTTSSVNFLTMNMTGGFSFSLKDPLNVIIDSTSQNYFSTFNEFGKIARYNIVNPKVGNWQLIIDPEPEGRLILNEVSIISNKHITVTTDSVSYFINQSFLITSEFIDGTNPILGAIVNAEIMKHDGSIDSLTLFDDGTHGDAAANDGKYSNNYPGTNIPGTLDIKSTGTKGNITRIYTEHIAIIPNSATLNGTYSESSIDSDADGLIDTLVINVGVNVNTAGNYMVSANLNHTQDTTITSATFISLGSTPLNAGLNTIKLLFIGSDIFDKGHDGPYLLSDVTLTDLQNNLQVDFSTQPFTTQAFTVTQFERPLLSLAGNNIESTSVINGKIRTLFVNFDVEILKPGSYDYNAELTDTNGNFIVWSGATKSVSSSQVGVITFLLVFSGNDINNKRYNGPYFVKNLSINTDNVNFPDANLYVKQLFTTSNFNFTDFEGRLIAVNVINTVTSTPIRNAQLILNGTESANSLKVFAFDSTNSNGQVLFGGINPGNYNIFAFKNSLSSDTTFFPIFLDSTSVTINMTIPNTLPVFTNLPDTISVLSNGNKLINIWNFISDNESPDSTLFFDFSSNPNKLNLFFDNTTGVLTVTPSDSNFAGNVFLKIRADDTIGGVIEDSILVILSIVTGLNNDQNIIPNKYTLSQNYPNPFNPTSNIQFGLPIKSNVEIIIYNVLGQQVVKLVNKEFTAGFHIVTFNAKNLASGVYFYRIKAGNFVQSKKMILLK